MTVKGETFLKSMDITIQLNRDTALKNITVEELIQIDVTLKKIITNCKID
jgi:hypothetical protein